MALYKYVYDYDYDLLVTACNRFCSRSSTSSCMRLLRTRNTLIT